MFGKNQAKILLRYYEMDHTTSHQQYGLSHNILRESHNILSEFVVKYPEISSFFCIFLCRKSSLTKTTDSCSFLLKRYLIIVNLSHITLSFKNHIMYICCWQINQRATNKLLPLIKILLLLLAKSPNARNFCFSLWFLFFYCLFSFSFSSLLIPLPQICRV